MTATPRVKVLYVLGTQRGGTTITGRLLGQLPGFAFLGELRKLWEVGVAEERRCGCGRSYSDCEVWSAVLPKLLADTDIDQVQQWQRLAAPDRRSSRQAWRLVRNGDRRHREAVASYTAKLGATYRALAETTGARVLVDTSKLPADAALITRLQGIDTFLVHLVRDPRGTVHSSIRRSDRPGGTHLRQSVFGSSGWLVRHVTATALRRTVEPGRSVVISYEDMVSDPNEALARVAALVGDRAPPDPVVVDGKVKFGEAHTPIGAGRFAPATVALALDDRWADDLGTLDRIVVTALAQPLARRFGYRLCAPRPAGEK